VRHDFHQHAQPLKLARGRQVRWPGEPCASMAFVLEGCVRVYLIGDDGREITLYRVHPGTGCVLTASSILGGTAFPASAVAESEVRGVTVPPPVFREWVDRHTLWRHHVFELVGRRLSAVLAKLEAAAFASVDTRLAAYLLTYFSGADSTSPVTQQEIANEIGSAQLNEMAAGRRPPCLRHDRRAADRASVQSDSGEVNSLIPRARRSSPTTRW
jgi:CRP/FNR family transcriptional regulator